MKCKFVTPAALLLLGSILFASFTLRLPIQRLQAAITTKQVKNGQSTTVKATMYYTAGGKMVTHFTQPREYVLLSNSKGEYKIYDPQNNTVQQSQNQLFSTDVTYFGHFLNNRSGDMGLRSMGFALLNTRFDEGAMITEWKPQLVDADSPYYIELVHENGEPIFIGYKDIGGKYMRKVFFYNYQKVQQVNLPLTITDINYLANGDSIVGRTQYADLLVNENATGKYFDYKIPQNAKLK
ncbi:hypothetical protein C7N43_17575 [Sphingobacteriales bacterium UPWRP_1]|nr:hypothetical protein BVG80_03920 [Sphingobacteriales bacterium TSM_CSM]PSJ75716.1 hypothetical protein C7N43_17575 [Sphingobacteriales bacterium UPWRP_1]